MLWRLVQVGGALVGVALSPKGGAGGQFSLQTGGEAHPLMYV